MFTQGQMGYLHWDHQQQLNEISFKPFYHYFSQHYSRLIKMLVKDDKNVPIINTLYIVLNFRYNIMIQQEVHNSPK